VAVTLAGKEMSSTIGMFELEASEKIKVDRAKCWAIYRVTVRKES
jgi:hypothetical protein